MQIREIHIDGFGIFCDKHLYELTSGINVIYGSNEYGKSTLLAFIRRVTFGFPHTLKKANPYPALNGGAYGGKLICELDNSEPIQIHRTEGAKSGKLTVFVGDRELSGQEELNKQLDYITQPFYENVYAFSLDELQAVRSLEEEDVRSRIYGAGLGLGRVSLGDVRGIFSKRSEDLFKPSGRSKKMHILYNKIREIEREIAQIRSALSHYDELVDQRDDAQSAVAELGDLIRSLEIEERSLENKNKLYTTYRDIKSMEKELEELGELPDFQDNTLVILEGHNSKLENIEEQIQDSTSELNNLINSRDGISYNERIIELEPDVNALHGLSEKYDSALKDQSVLEDEIKTLNESVQLELDQIGQSWSVDFVRSFKLTHQQRDKILEYKTRFEEANKKIASAQAKLEFRQDNNIIEKAKRFSAPSYLKNTVFLGLALGVIGTIAGAIIANWALIGFAVALLLTNIFLKTRFDKGSKQGTVDRLESEYRDNLDNAMAEYGKVETEWRDFLKSIDFSEDWAPDVSTTVLSSIQSIQGNLKAISDKQERIRKIQETISRVSELHDGITKCLDTRNLSDNISVNIGVISNHLAEAKEAKKNKEHLDKDVIKLQKKIEGLEKNKREIQDAISTLFASFDIEGESEFREKYGNFRRKGELEENIKIAVRNIQMVVGIGSNYEEFMTAMDSTNPEEIVVDLNRVKGSIKELQEQVSEKNQTIGELKSILGQLSSSDDLLDKQGEAELFKQQLNDCSREWIESRLALFVVDKAVSKYENTRQPEVIKAAEGIFSRITDHSYISIFKPIDSEELQIRDSSSNVKNFIEMSRGTKEQLYLAMRLGLIEEYEKHSQSMPIIMDDVIVNFDDDRGPLAINELKEFAKNRQVIVLTCHKSISDLLIDSGATEIIFN